MLTKLWSIIHYYDNIDRHSVSLFIFTAMAKEISVDYFSFIIAMAN